MEIITPKDYVGKLMELAQHRRGEFVDMQFLTEARTTLTYELPLAEVGFDIPSCRNPDSSVGSWRLSTHAADPQAKVSLDKRASLHHCR